MTICLFDKDWISVYNFVITWNLLENVVYFLRANHVLWPLLVSDYKQYVEPLYRTY